LTGVTVLAQIESVPVGAAAFDDDGAESKGGDKNSLAGHEPSSGRLVNWLRAATRVREGTQEGSGEGGHQQ